MADTTAPPPGKANYVHSGALTALVFLPPALTLFTIFVILPIGEAGWYGLLQLEWPGRAGELRRLQNYQQLLANKTFHQAFINNLLIIAVSLTVQLPLALAMAVLLADRLFGSVAFRMLFFLPYILADVAAGLIWRFMFDGDYGPISQIWQALGGDPLYILADRDWAYAAVLTVIVWKYFGFHMMLYIAGCRASTAISTRRRRSTAPVPGSASATSRCRASRR
jgi:raffinose/stachyose/melibiose transport system permease protein